MRLGIPGLCDFGVVFQCEGRNLIRTLNRISELRNQKDNRLPKNLIAGFQKRIYGRDYPLNTFPQTA